MTARVVMLITRGYVILFFFAFPNDHSPGELISVDANSFCKDTAGTVWISRECWGNFWKILIFNR